MLQNRSLLFFLLTLLMYSCIKPIGIYSWKGNKQSPDFYQLKLHADNTFTYYGWSDILGEDTIKGTWKLSKDTVNLAVQNKSKTPLITSIDRRNRTKGRFKVTVLDGMDSSYVLGSMVYLNNGEGQLVDSLGSVYSDKNIDKIKVEYLSYLDSVIVQDTFNNHFVIYLDFKANEIDGFYVSPKWLKRGKKLIPLGRNGNKIKDGIYKKL